MFEINDGGDHGVVDNHVAENLTGSRATKYGGPFEVVAEFAHDFTRLHQGSGAENESHTLSSDFTSWQIRPPPATLSPFVLCCFHESSPSQDKLSALIGRATPARTSAVPQPRVASRSYPAVSAARSVLCRSRRNRPRGPCPGRSPWRAL